MFKFALTLTTWLLRTEQQQPWGTRRACVNMKCWRLTFHYNTNDSTSVCRRKARHRGKAAAQDHNGDSLRGGGGPAGSGGGSPVPAPSKGKLPQRSAIQGQRAALLRWPSKPVFSCQEVYEQIVKGLFYGWTPQRASQAARPDLPPRLGPVPTCRLTASPVLALDRAATAATGRVVDRSPRRGAATSGQYRVASQLRRCTGARRRRRTCAPSVPMRARCAVVAAVVPSRQGPLHGLLCGLLPPSQPERNSVHFRCE